MSAERSLRAEAFDVISGETIATGDAQTAIGQCIATFDRALDAFSDLLEVGDEGGAVRMTIVLEAEVNEDD